VLRRLSAPSFAGDDLLTPPSGGLTLASCAFRQMASG